MKNIASIVVVILAIVFAPVNVSAQKSKLDTVNIKTSAECDMCKTKLEKEIGVMKGVKSVNLDLTTQVVTVVYNGSKTDVTKIKQAIANIGYDADEVKANNRAQKKLPACCKPGGMPGADSVPK